MTDCSGRSDTEILDTRSVLVGVVESLFPVSGALRRFWCLVGSRLLHLMGVYYDRLFFRCCVCSSISCGVVNVSSFRPVSDSADVSLSHL